MTPWELCRTEDLACAQIQMQIFRELGVSQSAIARHCGIHCSQVNRWARGKRVIPEKYEKTLHLITHEEWKRLWEASREDLDTCGTDGVLVQLQERIARLKTVNALYDQFIAIQEQMIEKLHAYADQGVVLRELWSIEHG